MFQIPRDGKLYAVVKARLRRPTELRGNFRRVNGVALVVTFAVGDELNQILTLAENAQNRLDDVQIRALIVPADVVDFADGAAPNNQVNRRAVILDVKPIANVYALAVDGQLFVVERVDNHERNQLFREVKRSVVVRAAADCRGDFVRALISLHEQIGGGFTGGIRA